MQPRFVTDSTLRYVYSVCVWNIVQFYAQMMLFNYTCSKEVTALPIFPFPW